MRDQARRSNLDWPNKFGQRIRRIASSAAFIFSALGIALPASSQAPRQGPAPVSSHADGLYRIAGRVVNAATGEPIRRANVAALSEEDSQTIAAVESDSDGRFSLERLPAAKYQLTASKRGFRTAFYDEHEEFNSAIVTGPDQDTEHLAFRLVPGAVIRGVVITDGGDPVENAGVLLFLKSHGGKPGLRVSQTGTAITDDTGAYEFTDLATGEYMLAVSAEPWYALHRSGPQRSKRAASIAGAPDPSAALDVAYPVTYFDSTTDEASATQLSVPGGSHVEANINLHAVPAIHISVETPRKQDGSVARAELRQTVFGAVIGTETTGFLEKGEGGSTEFNDVAPGHYELAQGDPPHVVEIDAAASMQVDPSLGASAVPIRGSLRTATGAALTDDCNLTLEPVDGEHHRDPIRVQCIHGGFRFPTVPAGEWQLTGESDGRLLPIASIAADGHARPGNSITVQDRPLALTVTVIQGATRVHGFARRAGKGVAGVMVVLIPSDMTALGGLIRRDQSDSDGSFSLRDVVPGRYTAVAIDDGWRLDWADARSMTRYLPGGIPVTVSDRSEKALVLSSPVPVQTR